MAYKKKILYISSQELIQQLKITPQKLKDIEDFFDAHDDDEWDLVKGKDYRVVVKATGLREYTLSGAHCIAEYLQKGEKHSFWINLIDNITEWFTGAKKKIRQNFVRQKILDNCSSLIKKNNTFFISRGDMMRIFETRSDYLSKMDEAARKFEINPLTKGEDYEEIEGILYYSLSGIPKLSEAFHQLIKLRNRKDWCQDVGEVFKPQVDQIVKAIQEREKNIQKMKNFVRETRDKKTCQITGEKKVPASNFKLSVHHLYCVNQYPHLADEASNLITIKQEIHDQFHDSYMGGKNKPCTIDDFLRFISEKYPENHDLQIILNAAKQKLGEQNPLGKRRPHVLFLPISQIM
jgi:hypothetical protein